MADVRAAERATGYVAGGISPFGQKRAHPTVLDETALDTTVYVSGGRRGLDVEIAPADLIGVTEAIEGSAGADGVAQLVVSRITRVRGVAVGQALSPSPSSGLRLSTDSWSPPAASTSRRRRRSSRRGPRWPCRPRARRP